jgi:hypothetical protein
LLDSFVLVSRISPTFELRTAVHDCIRGAHELLLYAVEHQHQALAFCMALVQQALPYSSHFASSLLSYMTVRCLTRQGT